MNYEVRDSYIFVVSTKLLDWENGTSSFNFLSLMADGTISSKGRPLGFQ